MNKSCHPAPGEVLLQRGFRQAQPDSFLKYVSQNNREKFKHASFFSTTY
jgi:hypothetical protein